ncbi:MAG TPA: glycosyltransferase, partial [Steroidobacteraceae bacterium]
RHPLLVLADSDIVVPRDYLTRVLAPLIEPQVGLVTCPYVGRPRGGLWSALGALFISDWFMANVRLTQLFGAQSFVSGATIALRRDVLDRLGHLSTVANELADDFRLGEQVRRLGLRIVLSDLYVETLVDEPTPSAFARHTLRWLRTIQSLQPWGYAFCFVTFSVPLALVGAALAHFNHDSVLLLEITVAARVMLHCFGARIGRAPLRSALRQLPLLPLHDLLLPALWCWSFSRRAVSWRQQQFEIGRDGALYRLPEIE